MLGYQKTESSNFRNEFRGQKIELEVQCGEYYTHAVYTRWEQIPDNFERLGQHKSEMPFCSKHIATCQEKLYVASIS